MKTRYLYIKNMVCPRCIRVVEEELTKAGLSVRTVELGRAEVVVPPEGIDYREIARILHQSGFDLLEDPEKQLVEKIKLVLIEYIRELESQEAVVKMSVFLADRLNVSYEQLSKLFSRFEPLTIEKYLIHLKIERVKELLSYDELTLSEIAFRLQYSSVQHLSNQFKQVTGITVREYRQRPYVHRHSLDQLSQDR